MYSDLLSLSIYLFIPLVNNAAVNISVQVSFSLIGILFSACTPKNGFIDGKNLFSSS